ncbi:MAG: hypothetical protein CDV28_1606 [Candidatus Electronema aureum]|uniref:DUF4469 domain-containing protein n=1 Tax=Candidatus Electronema aureum TaxID=2005002 RepID=A0A521FYE1_9BACT|nr:MAG: hypothetical protein CDV28_1606 [Candidatus Electronema aureum]
MATIQCRLEVNALTVPQSYKIRFVPRDSMDTDGIAAAMAAENPNYSLEDNKTMLANLVRVLQKNLINGTQSTVDGAFTFGFSFTGRLDNPDDPLPPAEDILRVDVHVLAPFLKEIRRQAQLERLPMIEKAPLINAAEDTVLGLDDVLHSGGALRLTGSNLLFDPKRSDEGCVIEGTRSGRAAQTRFAGISNAEVTLLPEFPTQNEPWNNEYILSLSTRYTENGTLRTGIYRRRLRAPLTAAQLGSPTPPETGILTDKAASPYVKITGGSLNADETVRVQAVLEHDGSLSVSLLDMSEGGRTGASVRVAANGAYVLPGFAGSALSSLNITVSRFADLVKMIRSGYSGRVVDVLVVKTA